MNTKILLSNKINKSLCILYESVNENSPKKILLNIYGLSKINILWTQR